MFINNFTEFINEASNNGSWALKLKSIPSFGIIKTRNKLEQFK